jgi:hypothetical protein
MKSHHESLILTKKPMRPFKKRASGGFVVVLKRAKIEPDGGYSVTGEVDKPHSFSPTKARRAEKASKIGTEITFIVT